MIPSFVVPTPRDLIMLILIGIFGAGGQIGLTYAYQKAPAAEVSIYDYSGIIFPQSWDMSCWANPCSVHHRGRSSSPPAGSGPTAPTGNRPQPTGNRSHLTQCRNH